jgi:predicted nucleic acid-binding protein
MPAPATDGAVLVDTNVIVYAHDRQAGSKHDRARELLAALSGEGRLWLSAQVLNEFAAVLLRRRAEQALSLEQITQLVEQVRALGEVVSVTGSMTTAALQGIQSHGLSFWDALLWVAARDHGIRQIYSEDFQHGRDLEGVVFLNPFVE